MKSSEELILETGAARYNSRMNNSEKLTLWLGATRYYLGRMTYAVSMFCDLLIKEWSDLPKDTQGIIKRDIEEEYERYAKYEQGIIKVSPLGMDMDKQQWDKVRELWK